MFESKFTTTAMAALLVVLASLASSSQIEAQEADLDETNPASAAGSPSSATGSPSSAAGSPFFDEGNRHFAEGNLELAARAYEAGFSSHEPHPTLVYNLATTLHHLDRLPEAILWYRRAGESDDPWLQENLWLARRSLGSQILPPAGITGWLAQRPQLIWWTALAVSWLTLVLCLAGRRSPLWLRGSLLAVAIGLYAIGYVVVHRGPQPAVLLQDCTTSVGDLPAGTEAWVQADGSDWWRVSGVDARCPRESAAVVTAAVVTAAELNADNSAATNPNS